MKAKLNSGNGGTYPFDNYLPFADEQEEKKRISRSWYPRGYGPKSKNGFTQIKPKNK